MTILFVKIRGFCLQRLVFSRKNSKFSYSRDFISPGMTILLVKIRGFCMRRLAFYVKTRGFRTVEPFGGVQWGSVWLLFGVLVRENTRFLCAEASFLRKNTRISRSGPFGGSIGALLGCCLLSFGSLWGPATAKLRVFTYKTEVHGVRLVPCSGP